MVGKTGSVGAQARAPLAHLAPSLAYLVHGVNGFVEVAEIWRTVRIHLDACFVEEQHRQRGNKGGESKRTGRHIPSARKLDTPSRRRSTLLLVHPRPYLPDSGVK